MSHPHRCPQCSVNAVPGERITLTLPLGQEWEGVVYTCQNKLDCFLVFIIGDQIEPAASSVPITTDP